VGAIPTRLISNPPPSIPSIYILDDLPAITLPIYPTLGQTQEYAGLHTLMVWLSRQSPITINAYMFLEMSKNSSNMN